MLIDEANSIGNLAIFKKGAAFFRSYGIVLYMIYQSLAQVQDTWQGTDSTGSLLENFGVWIVGPSMNADLCQKISNMIGNKKVKIKGSTKEIPLMPADEVRKLKELKIKYNRNGQPLKIEKPGECLVFARSLTIQSNTVPYFYYSEYSARNKFSES